jgi:hypothetical protein
MTRSASSADVPGCFTSDRAFPNPDVEIGIHARLRMSASVGILVYVRSIVFPVTVSKVSRRVLEFPLLATFAEAYGSSNLASRN